MPEVNGIAALASRRNSGAGVPGSAANVARYLPGEGQLPLYLSTEGSIPPALAQRPMEQILRRGPAVLVVVDYAQAKQGYSPVHTWSEHPHQIFQQLSGPGHVPGTEVVIGGTDRPSASLAGRRIRGEQAGMLDEAAKQACARGIGTGGAQRKMSCPL